MQINNVKVITISVPASSTGISLILLQIMITRKIHSPSENNQSMRNATCSQIVYLQHKLFFFSFFSFFFSSSFLFQTETARRIHSFILVFALEKGRRKIGDRICWFRGSGLIRWHKLG